MKNYCHISITTRKLVRKVISKLTQYLSKVYAEPIPTQQVIQEVQAGKENQAFSIPGKHSLVMNLQKTVAKKGSPDVLAPGNTRQWKDCQGLPKAQAMRLARCNASAWIEETLEQCMVIVAHSGLQVLTFVLEMHRAHGFVWWLLVPGELAVCRKQLSVSIFAECCCVFAPTEGTAYTLTDSEISTVYYQGFTLRSNYCSSYFLLTGVISNIFILDLCLL